MSTKLAELGALYTFQVPDGRWGACQVVGEDDEQVIVATLEYLEKKAPTGVKGLQILKQDWASWGGAPALVQVDARVPWWLSLVGVFSPVAKIKTCNAYGFWESCLGAWNRVQWKAWEKAPARKGPAIEIENVGKHPTMDEVRYDGDDPRFAEYVVQRRIRELRWTVGNRKEIDLSASALDELCLEVSGPLTLKLPPMLGSLEITGRADKVTVTGGSFAHPFRLAIISPTLCAPPKGMEDVQVVEYRALRDTDSAGLTKYTRLAELTLRGAPGRLTDARGLAKLKALRELTIYELYDLDPTHWPAPWPALEGLEIRGMRKSDAEILKKSQKGIGALEISGTRTEAWLAENLGNPFRYWEEDDRAFGRAAMNAWKKANGAAKKLGAKPAKPKAKAVLDALVVALNRADAKHGIDTLRRDEAADAYFVLARGMSIGAKDAETWLDALREW